MIKFISIIILALMVSGCSLLPKLTWNRTTTTLPISTDKSSKKETCVGDYKVDSIGNIISCSKGYYKNESNYNQKERSFTLQEKIGNFIRNLAGWSFWILLAALIFVPGAFGWVIGTVFNAAKSALAALIKAIQNAKVSGVEITDAVEAELENNPKIRKTVDKMRTNLKIRKQM